MRILQLAPVWETVPPPAYGGTETVVSALTEELVRRGHDVTLCASGDSCTSADLFSVVPRGLRSAGLVPSGMQYALMHATKAMRHARDYDLVHCHSGPPAELGMALSHLVDVPVLTTLHNDLTEDTRFIWSQYEGWYNAISHSHRAGLPELPLARCAGVVHNGIDIEGLPFRPEKSDYVLFIGRITASKAPHLAVEAARQAGARIVVAGKVATEDELEYFDCVFRPLIDGNNVEFVGEADAALKKELYGGARALLQPLQWEEPFGLVLVEAMACGTPVIAFPRGAAPELVIDGETGFLVDNVPGMVEALDLLDEIDPWRCREHVERCFSPSALADGYLALYEQILGIKETVHDHVPA